MTNLSDGLRELILNYAREHGLDVTVVEVPVGDRGEQKWYAALREARRAFCAGDLAVVVGPMPLVSGLN